MTNPNSITKEQLESIEPETDTIIQREEDEGVSLNIHVISGDAVDETNAKTYTREFGHYFVENNSSAAELLDEFIAELTTENSIISSFRRSRFASYEVIAEVCELNQSNVSFSGRKRVEIDVPSHSEHIETVTSFFDEVKNEIQS